MTGVQTCALPIYKYETEEGYIKWYDDTVSQKLEKQREKEERLKAEEEQLKAEAEKQAAEAKTAEEAKVEHNGDSCKIGRASCRERV